MPTAKKPINPNAVALAELLSDLEIADLLENARQKERDRLRTEQTAAYREKIAELLRIAENSLREAGQIAKDYKISFHFAAPDGSVKSFNDWNESSCYAGDGWYYDQSNQSSVEGVPVVTESWYSSSDNC